MTQFSAPQGYGAPQQMPQQYGQPQPQLPTPIMPQPDLQPMMYGQQQAYAAPPVQPQYQQPAPMQQNGHTGGFFTQQDPHLQAQQPAQPQFQEQQNFHQFGQHAPGPVDTSSFFGGAASISWDHTKGYVKGTYRGGQITDKKIVPQTKLGTNEILKWNDGSPRTQMVLTLQTTERVDPQDNGQRQMFLKGDAPRAAREAFQKVGAKDLELGGWYYQAWVDEKAAKQQGYNPQKIFAAVYAPPGSPDPMAGQAAFTPQPQQQAPQSWQPGMAEQVAPSVVNGVPQPHATPDQFAAYAATQANQQAAYAQPAQPMARPQQYQQPAPGPVGMSPQQAMANFQQAAQFDPAVQAAIGAPGQPLAQPQQFPQGQPVPYGALPGDLSAQQNVQQPAAAPGADYNPFGPQG